MTGWPWELALSDTADDVERKCVNIRSQLTLIAGPDVFPDDFIDYGIGIYSEIAARMREHGFATFGEFADFERRKEL